MLTTLALALSVFAVLALRLAWRAGRRQQRHAQRGWRLAGLAALLVALWPWSVLSGHDRGPALLLLTVMLIGIACVIQAGVASSGARARRERVASNERAESTSPWWRTGLVFLLAGPVAAAASLSLGLVLWRALTSFGHTPANVLAASMLFVPLCWAGLACWATLPLSLRLRSASLLSVAGLATLVLVVIGA